MRILHLSWEYPPVLYGGLGRHVHALANAQAGLGHEVVVITQSPTPQAPGADAGPVQVIRAGEQLDHPGSAGHDLLAWVSAMESAFIRAGLGFVGTWRPDAIHAHDWMVAHAAVELRRATQVPVVATIHATEAGRNGGWISSSLSTSIHCVESWLATTADCVITCSATMGAEVEELFGVSGLHIIPNGIDPADWRRPAAATERIRAERPGAHPLLAYAGRVEWEKGIQTLVEAVPLLRSHLPGLRVLVAGRGSYSDELHHLAAALGSGEAVEFLGWVSEEDLRAVLAAADLAVVPSLYEPFGLVALEAATIGTPLLVSRTGGLAEFAQEGHLASTFTPGSPDSLARAALADLADPWAMAARADRARAEVLDQFAWCDIAGRTDAVYDAAIRSVSAAYGDPLADATRRRHGAMLPHLPDPPGRVLHGTGT